MSIFNSLAVSVQFGNRQFWANSRKSRDCAEAYAMYAAQVIPQIDAEIAQKGHFRMKTIYLLINSPDIPNPWGSGQIFRMLPE